MSVSVGHVSCISEVIAKGSLLDLCGIKLRPGRWFAEVAQVVASAPRKAVPHVVDSFPQKAAPHAAPSTCQKAVVASTPRKAVPRLVDISPQKAAPHAAPSTCQKAVVAASPQKVAVTRRDRASRAPVDAIRRTASDEEKAEIDKQISIYGSWPAAKAASVFCEWLQVRATWTAQLVVKNDRGAIAPWVEARIDADGSFGVGCHVCEAAVATGLRVTGKKLFARHAVPRSYLHFAHFQMHSRSQGHLAAMSMLGYESAAPLPAWRPPPAPCQVGPRPLNFSIGYRVMYTGRPFVDYTHRCRAEPTLCGRCHDWGDRRICAKMSSAFATELWARDRAAIDSTANPLVMASLAQDIRDQVVLIEAVLSFADFSRKRTLLTFYIIYVYIYCM